MNFLLHLIGIWVGAGYGFNYIPVGDFNEHIRYLNEQASIIGYTGSMSEFSAYQCTPEFLIELIDTRHLGARVGIRYFRDRSKADFIKEGLICSEDFGFHLYLLNADCLAKFGKFYLVSGLERPYLHVNMRAESDYRKVAHSFNANTLGIYYGVGSSTQISRRLKILLEVYRRYEWLKSNDDIWFNETEGYIFHSKEIFDTEHIRPVIFDLTGFAIRSCLTSNF